MKNEKAIKQRLNEMVNHKSAATEKAVREIVTGATATPSERAEKTFHAYLDTVAHIESAEPSTEPSNQGKQPTGGAEPQTNDGTPRPEDNQHLFTRVLRRAIDETLTEPTGAVVLSVRSIVTVMLAEYFSTYGVRERLLTEGWTTLCETLGWLIDKNKGFPGTATRAEVMDKVNDAISYVRNMDDYNAEVVPRQRRNRLRYIDRYVNMFVRERERLLADKAEHPENY